MVINNVNSDYRKNKNISCAVINMLAAKLKTNEYGSYTDIIDAIIELYQYNIIQVHTATILSTIKELKYREHKRFTYYDVIILKSIVDLLTANVTSVDFQMYYDLKQENQPKEHKIDFDINIPPYLASSKTNELMYLFNQIGIKQTGFLLLLIYDIIRT